MFKQLTQSLKSAATLALLAVGIMAAATSAKAQTYGASSFGAPGGTNTITAAQTSNCTTVVDMRYNRQLGIQLQGAAIGTNTTLKLNLFPSLDGGSSNFDTATWFAVQMTIPTNTVAVLTTNIDVGAIGYIKGTVVAGNNLVTNCFVEFSQKPPPN